MTFRLPLRKGICYCGIEFETSHAFKRHCSKECKNKFKETNRSDRIKKSYFHRCKRMLQSSQHRAKIQGLTHDLTLEFLLELWEKQEGRCVISGREFDLRKASEGSGKPWPNTPSLDKKIPNEGYVKDNVRFVCHQVNSALHTYGDAALISLCKDIVEYNEGIIH